MNGKRNVRIVVDAGHGGYDNGASFEGRMEKNDNLRLALAVEKQLVAQGADVIMTRSDDTFIPLQERAKIANENNADLFISLHRNSYTEQTPSTKGVENFIYLTAPEQTSGRAAAYVLDEVVKVGVLDNRGVKRGNFYVLRKTKMPSMLLEMGYIINPEDNRLFDENLDEYAVAIAKGALKYFGIPFLACPGCANETIAAAQAMLNSRYGYSLPVDGVYGQQTKMALIMALQAELNRTFGSGLLVDGKFGAKTKAAIPTLTLGAAGNIVYLFQLLLMLNGYDPGDPDGMFGDGTKQVVAQYQRDNRLKPDGIIGPNTIDKLLS